MKHTYLKAFIVTVAGVLLLAGRAQAVQAMGGTVKHFTENGTNFTAHIFTNVGTANFVFLSGGEVQYLVVAGGGGGGGGHEGGGGGAGGLRVGSTYLTAATYTISVGSGGNGCRGDGSTPASNGQGSSISNGTVTIVTTTGGGSGSSEAPNAAPSVGGSGGGGGHSGGLTGANGTSGEGNKGGDSTDPGGFPCGGGGGAGSAGGAATVADTPGLGGAGTNLTFSGSPVTYAAGGKGGWRPGSAYTGSNGVVSTGSGGEGAGGAAAGVGGNGGSGIVIIRYSVAALTTRNQPVTSVATNSATFNGLLTDVRSPAPDVVYVLWGTDTNAWANTNRWTGGGWTNNTPFSTNVSLRANTTYYYTFGASNSTTNVVSSPPVSFLTGAVRVKTSRRESSEDRPADFVIFRPATATNGALAVNYTLGGTGVNGSDYDQLDSPAIIPDGASEIRLPVVPRFNMSDVRPRIVTLTIEPGAYTIGAQSNTTILTRLPRE